MRHPGPGCSRAAFALGLLLVLGSNGAPRASAQPPVSYTYAKPYEFVSDWFSPAIPSWEVALAPYVGRPGLRYLEVGVFQGRSLFWVLENVATHPTSRITGVDIGIHWIAPNLAVSGAADRIQMIKGRSQEILPTLERDSYDVIYIDGSHRGDDVLIDAVASWALLKVGGTLIFDDYGWHVEPSVVSPLVLPVDLRPKEAIDTFTTLFRDQLEVLHRGHQLIVRRKPARCAGHNPDYCSPVGRYVYDWQKREVRDPASGATVAVTPAERKALEQLLPGLRVGGVVEPWPADPAHPAALRSVAAKLELERPAP